MGSSTYLEVILTRITTPVPAKLQIGFFHQLTFPVPHLSQFMGSTGSPKFSSINLEFSKKNLTLQVYPHKGADMSTYTMQLRVDSCRLDRQVASAAQILNTPLTALSTVDHFTLEHNEKLHENAQCTHWCELLKVVGQFEDTSGTQQPCRGTISLFAIRGYGTTDGSVTRIEGARVYCHRRCQ